MSQHQGTLFRKPQQLALMSYHATSPVSFRTRVVDAVPKRTLQCTALRNANWPHPITVLSGTSVARFAGFTAKRTCGEMANVEEPLQAFSLYSLVGTAVVRASSSD